jgi:hypothetical protein
VQRGNALVPTDELPSDDPKFGMRTALTLRHHARLLSQAANAHQRSLLCREFGTTYPLVCARGGALVARTRRRLSAALLDAADEPRAARCVARSAKVSNLTQIFSSI